jgi:hypothetical protein
VEFWSDDFLIQATSTNIEGEGEAADSQWECDGSSGPPGSQVHTGRHGEGVAENSVDDEDGVEDAQRQIEGPVMTREVTKDEFLARLAPQERSQIEAALAAGQGVALYVNGRGAGVVGITFGTREATLPGNPPKLYGDGELDVFVPPRPPPECGHR